jgi:hypothetical protein
VNLCWSESSTTPPSRRAPAEQPKNYQRHSRGWSFAYVGADQLFAWMVVAVVAIGLGIWLVSSLLG